MIRFGCPNCKAVLTAGDEHASTKMACPKCGQHLLTPPLPAPLAPVNRTLLADDLSLPVRQYSAQGVEVSDAVKREVLGIFREKKHRPG